GGPRRGGVWRCAELRPPRQFPDPLGERREPGAQAPRRLRDPRALCRARLRELVPGSLPAHGALDRRLDAAWLRARRDEYRQSFDTRRDPRLRSLWMARGLRSDVDA